MSECGKHMISIFFVCLFCFCFSSKACGTEAFILQKRRTYLRKTDFYTQRVVGRKYTPPSGNNVAPRGLSHWLDRFSGSRTAQKAAEGALYGRKCRSTNTGTCTESTIPSRGNDSALRTETRYYFIPK